MEEFLDEKDLTILELLKEHGEYTTRQIAKKTLLPPTTIHNRIRKLIQGKVIKKFTVDIDNKKIGKAFRVYVLISANIQTLKEKKKTQYDVVKELRRYDFVERADIVSGGTDIVAIILVGDVEEFDKVLLGKVQLIDGVDKTQSLIVIHES
jgi:Lrp/AsnC family transcriptional regulator, regulator for asnA, asnC and gidA